MIIIEKSQTENNNFSFEATIENENYLTDNKDDKLPCKEFNEEKKIGTNFKSAFLELQKILRNYFISLKNDQDTDKDRNLTYYNNMYFIYKSFATEIALLFPESQQLISKFINDFDEIINKFNAEFKKSAEIHKVLKKKIASMKFY